MEAPFSNDEFDYHLIAYGGYHSLDEANSVTPCTTRLFSR
jgi:hypothetical protein